MSKLTNVRGRFIRFDVILVVGDSVDDTAINAAVDIAMVDTYQPDRDAYLRSTNCKARLRSS